MSSHVVVIIVYVVVIVVVVLWAPLRALYVVAVIPVVVARCHKLATTLPTSYLPLLSSRAAAEDAAVAAVGISNVAVSAVAVAKALPTMLHAVALLSWLSHAAIYSQLRC